MSVSSHLKALGVGEEAISWVLKIYSNKDRQLSKMRDKLADSLHGELVDKIKRQKEQILGMNNTIKKLNKKIATLEKEVANKKEA